jgi:hypothetical protein
MSLWLDTEEVKALIKTELGIEKTAEEIQRYILRSQRELQRRTSRSFEISRRTEFFALSSQFINLDFPVKEIYSILILPEGISTAYEVNKESGSLFLSVDAFKKSAVVQYCAGYEVIPESIKDIVLFILKKNLLKEMHFKSYDGKMLSSIKIGDYAETTSIEYLNLLEKDLEEQIRLLSRIPC